MTQDKDIIYVNGDSFTAGSDLADYLLPGYPEEITLNDMVNNHDTNRINSYTEWKREQQKKKIVNFKYLSDIETSNRWSNKLSMIINKPVLNKSHPGSDNFSIFARTCSDIEKLRASGTTVSKIIIQITGFMRYSYIRSAEYSSGDVFKLDIRTLHRLELADGFFFRHLMPMYMGSSIITKAENEFLKRSLYEEVVYGDQPQSSKLIGHLLNLKMFKDAVRGVSGVDPIIVDSLFMKTYLHYTYSAKYLENKDSYVYKLFENVFSDQLMTMFDIPDFYEKSITCGGHFNAKVHEKFAEKIAERYFK